MSMNSERLLMAATRLERNAKHPPKVKGLNVKFDLHTWYKANCVTAACAVGECGMAKEFNAMGFSLLETHALAGLPPSPASFPVRLAPIYQVEGQERTSNWAAVQAFFDIGYRQASYLFNEKSYNEPRITRRTVAKRIRAFVMGGGEVPYGW
jgi:hypothetical protein